MPVTLHIKAAQSNDGNNLDRHSARATNIKPLPRYGKVNRCLRVPRYRLLQTPAATPIDRGHGASTSKHTRTATDLIPAEVLEERHRRESSAATNRTWSACTGNRTKKHAARSHSYRLVHARKRTRTERGQPLLLPCTTIVYTTNVQIRRAITAFYR